MIECPNQNCARSANLVVHESGPTYVEDTDAIDGAYLDVECTNCGKFFQVSFHCLVPGGFE